MSPEEVVRDVLKRVEDASNVPVLVNADPSLNVLASVQIARGNAPAHLVPYNPAFSDAVDYAICFQCGFVLRLFTAAKENRFDVASSYRGRKESERLVTERLRESVMGALDKATRTRIAQQIYDGIIRQLRSMPVGIRVDQWLSSEYPDLHGQQRLFAHKQLQDNLQALRPEVKRMAPVLVYDANVAMNAAIAIFWSSRWNDAKLVTPYTATGHDTAGQRLISVLQTIPSTPDHDRALIDAWGTELNLKDWYEFVPVGNG
jgi:hypothetical protein